MTKRLRLFMSYFRDEWRLGVPWALVWAWRISGVRARLSEQAEEETAA